MKKREISLDFTSLLDVVLIMLFFFILFGSLDVDEAKKAAQEAEKGYNVKTAEVEAEREQLEQEYVSLTQAEYDRLNAEYVRLTEENLSQTAAIRESLEVERKQLEDEYTALTQAEYDRLNAEFEERTRSALSEADAAKKEAEEQAQIYSEKSEELDKLKEDEEARIAILENSDPASASTGKELLSFIDGANLKLLLCIDEYDWHLKAQLGEKEISLKSTDNLSGSIIQFLKSSGYDSQSVILCEFIYDGSKPYSGDGYETFERAVQDIREEIDSFYVSVTNIS